MSYLFSKQRIIESVSLLLFANVFLRLIGIPQRILVARLLKPSQLGIYSLAMRTLEGPFSLLLLGMASVCIRYSEQYHKQGVLKQFLKKIYSVPIIVYLAAGVIFYLCSEGISKLIYNSGQYRNIVVVLSAMGIIKALYNLLYDTFQSLQFFRLRVLLRLSYSMLFLIIGISLIYYVPRAEYLLFGNLFSYALALAIFGIPFFHYISEEEKPNTKLEENGFNRRIFAFAGWILVTDLAFATLGFTDGWMINRFLSSEDVGIYFIGLSLVELIYYSIASVREVLLPKVCEVYDQGAKQKVDFSIPIATKFSSCIIFLAYLIIVPFRKEIIVFLFGTDYVKSAILIPIFFGLIGFRMLLFTNEIYLMAVEKMKFESLSLCIGACLNVILNYKLIHFFGVKGAALATALSFAGASFGVIFFNVKYGLRYDWRFYAVPLSFFFMLLFEFGFYYVVPGVVLLVLSFNSDEKRNLLRRFSETCNGVRRRLSGQR